MTSTTYDRAAFAHETNESVLTLLELDNAEMGTPIRVTNNRGDITHGGNVYTAFPFFIKKPNNLPDEMPRAELSVCGVDQTVVDAIRSISIPLEATITTVLGSTPDVIEDGPYVMTLRDVVYSEGVVSGSLVLDDIMNEPYPADAYDPINSPGLF